MSTPQQKEPVYFYYSFAIERGQQISYKINLDPTTLEFINGPEPGDEDWTRLSYSICDDCPLKAKGIEHCPVAVKLADLVKAFSEVQSFEIADVEVATHERLIVKKQVPVQQGLSSILGIVMVSSGCPDLDFLRPMVRLHLPFSSIEETTYRSTSMYLLAQFTRARNDLEPDWTMEGLKDIYQRIDHINRRMVKRMQSATVQDASLNAVVILDTFAQMVPLSVGGTLRDMEYLFWPYLQDSKQNLS